MANRDFENWGGWRNVVARRFGLAEPLLFVFICFEFSTALCKDPCVDCYVVDLAIVND